MSEIESTEAGSRELGRRSVIKGAAWSVPVIAAAVAAPVAAAATPPKVAGLDLSAGCVQIVGLQLLPGFSIANTGTAAYTGTITVTEKIDLTAISSSFVRGTVWGILLLGGIINGASAGITKGAWTGSGGLVPTVNTRTVTFTGTIAPSASIAWGTLFNVNAISNVLGLIKHTAEIISPVGNPPVVDAGPRELDGSLLGGC